MGSDAFVIVVGISHFDVRTGIRHDAHAALFVDGEEEGLVHVTLRIADADGEAEAGLAGVAHETVEDALTKEVGREQMVKRRLGETAVEEGVPVLEDGEPVDVVGKDITGIVRHLRQRVARLAVNMIGVEARTYLKRIGLVVGTHPLDAFLKVGSLHVALSHQIVRLGLLATARYEK